MEEWKWWQSREMPSVIEIETGWKYLKLIEMTMKASRKSLWMKRKRKKRK